MGPAEGGGERGRRLSGPMSSSFLFLHSCRRKERGSTGAGRKKDTAGPDLSFFVLSLQEKGEKNSKKAGGKKKKGGDKA